VPFAVEPHFQFAIASGALATNAVLPAASEYGVNVSVFVAAVNAVITVSSATTVIMPVALVATDFTDLVALVPDALSQPKAPAAGSADPCCAASEIAVLQEDAARMTSVTFARTV
jgi:hypothetical protein